MLAIGLAFLVTVGVATAQSSSPSSSPSPSPSSTPASGVQGAPNTGGGF